MVVKYTMTPAFYEDKKKMIKRNPEAEKMSPQLPGAENENSKK